MLNGAAISWRASRTTLIVLNAAEAELYSLSSATQEAIYLRKMCIELGFLQTNPTIMYEDCQAAVALSKENRFRNRSKHISLRWSFVVERQKSCHWRHNRCGNQPYRYACRYFLLTSTRIEFHSIPQHNIGTPTDAHRIATNWGEGRLLLDLGSCRLWIPNGSLPCSPIIWHALVMQNTTIVWLSINLMWNLSSKVFARKIWNLLGLLFSPQLTHPSTCIIPLLCDCLSIWCAIWTTKCLQICHLRVLPFPPR